MTFSNSFIQGLSYPVHWSTKRAPWRDEWNYGSLLLSQTGLHLSHRFHGFHLVPEPNWFHMKERSESKGTQINLKHLGAVFVFYGVVTVLAWIPFILEVFRGGRIAE